MKVLVLPLDKMQDARNICSQWLHQFGQIGSTHCQDSPLLIDIVWRAKIIRAFGLKSYLVKDSWNLIINTEADSLESMYGSKVHLKFRLFNVFIHWFLLLAGKPLGLITNTLLIKKYNINPTFFANSPVSVNKSLLWVCVSCTNQQERWMVAAEKQFDQKVVSDHRRAGFRRF